MAMGDSPPDGATPEQLEQWLKDQNLRLMMVAADDLNIRNRAKIALLHAEHGIEIGVVEILNLKLEVLVDHIWKDDGLKRMEVNFDLQKRIADHLGHVEAHLKNPEGESHDHDH